MKQRIKDEKISVFYSYSHEDEKMRKKLEEHLSVLQRLDLIAGWHDRNISAGTEWSSEISIHLDNAQIILMLISASFIASEYCYSTEMARALKRHETGSARVIPIILRPVHWTIAPFNKLQALPTEGKPVTEWRNVDQAFADIT